MNDSRKNVPYSLEVCGLCNKKIEFEDHEKIDTILSIVWDVCGIVCSDCRQHVDNAESALNNSDMGL